MPSSPVKYKALLIDLDGVIRQWNPSDENIEVSCDLPIGSIRQVAFDPPLVELAITGQITDEEWHRRTVETLRQRFGAPNAHKAVARWASFPGRVDTKTLDILDRCSPSLRTVLVTNATSKLACELLELGLTERFFAVVNASEVGVSKPGQKIFHVALQRAEVCAEQALFIDDSLRNVEAASALNICSHQFTGHDAMTAFLRKNGVLD